MQKGNFVSIDMPKVEYPKPDQKSVSRGVFYSLFAGLSAAGASVFGKLAMDTTYIHTWLSFVMDIERPFFTQVEFVMRIICFGMVVACNSILWNFLAKSMDLSSSVDAVVINNAFNFFFTALLGWVLFGEQLNFAWFLGASIILLGVYLMTIGQAVESKKTAKA